MNSEMRDLIHGYFDGDLSQEQAAALNSWLKSSPGNANEFAGICRLHDGLRAHFVARNSNEAAEHPFGKRAVHSNRWARVIWIGGGIAAVLAIAVGIVWMFPARVDAATEMDRLIRSASSAQDCSYIIHNVDDQPEKPEERRPPIDGATLDVRPPNHYVLTRHFSDGRSFITGSNGKEAWVVPPDGAVRVSHDLTKWSGPLPGHEHGIPFANLRSDLVELRDAYVLTLLPSDSSGLRTLRAEKKSQEYRGPRQVEIRYDARTGVIQQMVFTGMPQAHGGPRRLSVDLAGQKDLGSTFFEHAAHHSSDRRVVDED